MFQRAQMKMERYFDLFHEIELCLQSSSPRAQTYQICVCVQTVTLYLVKWCSLPYEDSTWELKADIDQSKIDEYERIASRTPNTKRVVSGSVSVCLKKFLPRRVCMLLCVLAGCLLLPFPDLQLL